jgi:aspartate 1-decarboxylase
MFLKALKSKIHRATVTDTQLDYPGSIAIDPVLMEAAGIAQYEEVLIADVTNGNRFETYAIPVVSAKRGSGYVIIMGAAAHLAKAGDIIIIINFGYFTPDELASHKPKVVFVDEKNKIKQNSKS